MLDTLLWNSALLLTGAQTITDCAEPAAIRAARGMGTAASAAPGLPAAAPADGCPARRLFWRGARRHQGGASHVPPAANAHATGDDSRAAGSLPPGAVDPLPHDCPGAPPLRLLAMCDQPLQIALTSQLGSPLTLQGLFSRD